MKVKIRLTEWLLGTVPKNKELYKDFIASKAPEALDTSEEIETIEEMEEKRWTGFHSDERGIFVFDFFLKGFLKNAANVLKNNLGIRALRNKVNDYVFVFPRRIYLGKKQPDGFHERPILFRSPRGFMLTSLIRSDYIKDGTELEFIIQILKHSEINETVVKNLLKYGQFMGLGQNRNSGFGRFEVVSCEETATFSIKDA